MTYAAGGLIQALDYNTFATFANNIGNVFCIGSSDSGYGQLSNGFATIQTVSSAAAPTGTITAQQWNWLIQATNVSLKHQQGVAYANVANVQASTALNDLTVADGVIYATVSQSGSRVSLASLIATADTNRRNASAQGATASTVGTNNTAWRDVLTFTASVAFASADQARYFFNAGGQVGINLAHPSTGAFNINTLIADLCSELGTIWLSSGTASLAGTTYTGLTQVGGTPDRCSINTGLGFYALTSSFQQGVRQTSDFSYRVYSTSFLTLNYSFTGSTLTIQATIDEVFTSGTGTFVGTPTTCTCLLRNPDTTYLTASWGTPTVTVTVTAVS